MRKLLATAVLTLATLAVAAPAGAGGWAVTTLDPLAAAPVAGQPFDVGFTILQHGRTPVTMPEAAIVAPTRQASRRASPRCRRVRSGTTWRRSSCRPTAATAGPSTTASGSRTSAR